jgi:hypothetical protein
MRHLRARTAPESAAESPAESFDETGVSFFSGLAIGLPLGLWAWHGVAKLASLVWQTAF